MESNHDNQNLVKRVTEATLKAISSRTDVEVTFAPGGRGISRASDRIEARLPIPSRELQPEQLTLLRGEADASALRLRYHDPDLFNRQRPNSQVSARLFEAAEQARVEAIGCGQLAGLAVNLAEYQEATCRSLGHHLVEEKLDEHIPDAVALILRERLTSQPVPPSSKKLVDLWRPWVEENISDKLDNLQKHLTDQESFGTNLQDILEDLQLPSNTDVDDETSESSEQEQDNDQQAESEDEDNQDPDMDLQEDGSEQFEFSDQDSTDEIEDLIETDDIEDAPDATSEGETKRPDSENERSQPYSAFSTQFDEIVVAEELCDHDELSRLRLQLDQQLANMQGVVSRLANRLQRKLMAQQQRWWEFDLEEGFLDSGRLPRVVVNPLYPLSYKIEKEHNFRDTIVTLLIDNSGSMRGRPISVAAMSADIISRTLERCAVKVEVLGFTTRAWKGGEARNQWVAANKPNNPGRLNDLRHIIYKAADAPWRRSRRNLGLMLREGLLKENIDGEALMWAYNRLVNRPEQRRILMVISDGAPVDDATLSVNPGNYLEKHLRQVIKFIQSRTPVEITAIGIGHDVTRYYERAVTINDAEELGGTMMQNLTELFEEETTYRKR